MTFCFLLGTGCDQSNKPGEGVKNEASEKSDAAKPARRAPEKGSVAHIPVGEFLAGGLPGEPGRRPALEPLQRTVELGPFRIDAYPFPGDPSGKPRVGVTSIEAQALCASKGGRLCTELEWERACRGPESATYPTGSKACKDGDGLCLSGFDVARMTTLPEWTASKFGAGSELKGKHVARGAPRDVPPNERRCARRESPDKDDQPVGFRCCYGAPNAQVMKEPELGPAYQEKEIDKKELVALLQSNERTKSLSKDVSLFKPEAARTVLARGPGDTMGFSLTTNGVIWQPVRGSKFWVVAAKSGEKTSFVLAYYLAGDEKKLAGSFVMKNEPGPIALAYAKSIRPRIHFSGCWGCPGETGKVLFRPPEQVVLLQP